MNEGSGTSKGILVLGKIFSISKFYSVSANKFTLGISHVNYHANKIISSIGFSLNYMKIFWQDNRQNTSGDFNLIIPGVFAGVSMFPYQFDWMIDDINLGFTLAFVVTTLPASFDINDGTETLNDWKISVLPAILLDFSFPKD